MARPLRLEYPGAIYHITARGNARQKIFVSDHDKDKFLEKLSKVIERFGWLSYAYCLMDNHYHLVIETPRANLSSGMRQLNGTWAQEHNRSTKKSGHLFQGRFKALLIERDSYLLEVMRYVLLNPVRAGLYAMPEEYRYTSFPSMIGSGKKTDPVCVDLALSRFGKKRKAACAAFLSFIIDGIGARSPLNDLKAQIFLGGERFVEQHTLNLADEILGEIPRDQRPDPRPPFGQLIKHRKDEDGIYMAFAEWGYSQKAIADYLRVHYSTVSRMVKKHEARG